jgi:hypothetical protein
MSTPDNGSRATNSVVQDIHRTRERRARTGEKAEWASEQSEREKRQNPNRTHANVLTALDVHTEAPKLLSSVVSNSAATSSRTAALHAPPQNHCDKQADRRTGRRSGRQIDVKRYRKQQPVGCPQGNNKDDEKKEANIRVNVWQSWVAKLLKLPFRDEAPWVALFGKISPSPTCISAAELRAAS